MIRKYRYPGAPSFQKEDAHIFFGRDKEAKDLIRMIRLEQMTILYGKSGLGKTSLLNAGVLPKLEAIDEEAEGHSYQCLKIRFFAWKDQNSQSPLQTLQKELHQKQTSHPALDKLGLRMDSLWYSFKKLQLNQESNPTFVLVFDQFEELFTYPESDIEAFKAALAQLLHAGMPTEFKQALRANSRTLSKAEKMALLQAIPIKIVMGIRSDRISLLDKLTDYLPNVLVNMYELKPLSRVQASATILAPAAQIGDFDTPPFSYKDEALEAMLQHLEGEQGNIEPFQIQYLCEHAEHIVEKTGNTNLNKADLGDFSQLFSNYYNDKIATIGNSTEQKKARKLLEDGLLFRDVRLSLLEEQITDKRGFDIPLPLLQNLEDERLLRAERRAEQTYYEITHDTLVAPVLESKEERQRQERRRRGLIGVGLSLLLLLLAAFAVWSFYDIAKEARENEKKAIDNQEKADSTLTIVEQQKDSISIILTQLTLALAEADTATSRALLENNRFRKSVSTYLMTEAQKAFEKDDSRMALRLAQEAMEYYKENDKIRPLLTQIKSYLAHDFTNTTAYNVRFSEDGKYASLLKDRDPGNRQGTLVLLNLARGRKQEFKNSSFELISPDSKYFSFIQNKKDSIGTLNILNLKSGERIKFENCEVTYPRFSSNTPYLTFYRNSQGEKANLNLLNLNTGEIKTFENTSKNRVFHNPSSKYSCFFSEVKDSTATLFFFNKETGAIQSIANCYLKGYDFNRQNRMSFYTDVNGNYGTLNILNLNSGEVSGFTNSYITFRRLSPNGKFINFLTDVRDSICTLNLIDLNTGKKEVFEKVSKFHNTFTRDSSLFYFFKDVLDTLGTLVTINLSNFQKREFKNIHTSNFNFKYTDKEKYLWFTRKLKNGLDNMGILNVSTGHIQNYQSYDGITPQVSRHFLTYFTKNDDANLINFNLINLSTGEKKEVKDIYNYECRYSRDGNYFTFYKNVDRKKNIGILSCINLLSGEKIDFKDSYLNHSEYSYSGNYFTFFTDVKEPAYPKRPSGTLRFLNLSKGEVTDFENCDLTWTAYSYDGKYFSFSRVHDNKPNTLGLFYIESGEIKEFGQIPHSSSFKNIFYDEGPYLNIVGPDKKSLTLFDLNQSKKVRTIRTQNEIYRTMLSSDYKFVGIYTTYPGTRTTGVVKIIPTYINDAQAFEYFNKTFTPLSREERVSYGLQ